jgi:hypothetical protein
MENWESELTIFLVLYCLAFLLGEVESCYVFHLNLSHLRDLLICIVFLIYALEYDCSV